MNTCWSGRRHVASQLVNSVQKRRRRRAGGDDGQSGGGRNIGGEPFDGLDIIAGRKRSIPSTH